MSEIFEYPVEDTYIRNYCSVSDVKSLLLGLNVDLDTVWGESFTTEDIIQYEALEIEELTGRYFFPVRFSELHDGGRTYIVPHHLPIIEVEQCYYDGDSTNDLLEDIIVSPFRIRSYSMFPSGLDNITLVYVAGYETVPYHIRWANAIAVAIRALTSDSDWLERIMSSGVGSGSGERLTVGPVVMQEGGLGWKGLIDSKLGRLCQRYIRAIQKEQSIGMKLTTREDAHPKFHEWIFEDQAGVGSKV